MKTLPFSPFLSILLLFCSCTNNRCDCFIEHSSKEIPTEYKNKTDSALFFHRGQYFMDGDSRHLDSALFLLNQAVEFAPELLPAYFYKSLIYETKGDFSLTIETIDSAINNAYPTPDILFLKARALDYLNKTKEADIVLKETEALFSQLINCFPDSINLIAAEIEFTAYHKGKEAALNEVKKYLKKFPNNDLLIGFGDFLKEEPQESMLFRKK